MKKLCWPERLEPRCVFSSDWHNFDLPCDVDRSGRVTALDALLVINALSRGGPRTLEPTNAQTALVIDTNNDGRLSALDALRVINVIARHRAPLTLSTSTSAADQDGNGIVVSSELVVLGSSLPNVSVTASVNGLARRTTSDAQGLFEIAVPIGLGSSSIQVHVRDAIGRSLTSSVLVQRGDVVHNWNASALNVVRSWTDRSNDPYPGRIVPSQPPMVARNLAMIHTAMFDAVNAMERGYQPYLKSIPLPPADASPVAAALGAAYAVSTALYDDPDELSIWDATLAESLRTVVDEHAKTVGLAYGKVVGEAMLASRATDGASAPSTYMPGSDPGDWTRTYPAYLPPLLPQWPQLTPFVVESIEAFRPIPPPALTSAEYATAVDEVMRLGELTSSIRTPEQTEIAVFWADGGGTATPPGHWNRIASDISVGRGFSLIENSRLFAALNLALADAGIASWDAKYAYDLWRPIDAIREADRDGNDATRANPDWLPLLLTPPFPAYTSGHSTFSGAADAVLTQLLGDNVRFSSTSDPQNAPSQRPIAADQIVTRSFGSIREAAEEAGMSRIYGGIHFNFDNTAGLAAGRAIGSTTVANFLQPVA